jgi:hypothetical protein
MRGPKSVGAIDNASAAVGRDPHFRSGRWSRNRGGQDACKQQASVAHVVVLPAISFAPQCRAALSSRRYYNLGLHIWMQTAEIFKRSRFIEGETEFVLGVERRRTKRAVQ